jgi:hypothetical protein
MEFHGSTAFDGFFPVNAIVPQGVTPGIVPVTVTIGGQPRLAGIAIAHARLSRLSSLSPDSFIPLTVRYILSPTYIWWAVRRKLWV